MARKSINNMSDKEILDIADGHIFQALERCGNVQVRYLYHGKAVKVNEVIQVLADARKKLAKIRMEGIV